ncbi:MAG: coenzyme F420-0:L-glutamate ligase [Candidatus Nanopelagicales bacterium]|nr:coenzyme F420-0:L-glutamate ligase [Candidatus Nanopelagicales bacterium]
MITLTGIAIDHSFVEGDNLAGIMSQAIAHHSDLPGGLSDGDIVVVTSKIVAKVEGRTISAQDREDAITAETVRVVATKVHDRGTTRIVETEHGLILAAAGVDASNTEDGTVVLLPRDPDASARQLKQALESTHGITVGVIITDTLGRAWRLGVTDHAIGAAGVQVLDDLTGTTDSFGQQLHMTVVAIADQLAAASELVRAKASMTPVAVIRGAQQWVTASDSRARDLIRPPEEDLFPLGTAEAREQGARDAVFQRRTVRSFTADPVPPEVIDRAISAAATAPAPHHTTPWRFLVLNTGQHDQQRTELLDAMQRAWEKDLIAEGRSADEVQRRVARGNILRTAPTVIFPFMDLGAGAHTYPIISGEDIHQRNDSERTMFAIAGGAAVENMLISIATDNFGSAWISSSIFCPETMREVLHLPDTYIPLGGIAVGKPAHPAAAREPRDIDSLLIRGKTDR